ncbi:diacylglycerol kinase [Mesorhizobium xinjiangense]|uniref:diacylglycerol kinase n=1 Tax=Mesorhizobium xinjiangense TaxID=2678685 RepID=UPI0012EE7E32|nr:diacylglycerol kinase [Mesorhizobium xinjiangense]
MERIINAAINSWRAYRYLVRHETAFRQELVILTLALPLGWLLAATWRGYALLLAAILLVILVEVLNTGIEAACDAFSREFNVDIQLAKDCGSLAVAIAIVIAGGVWLLALVERLTGSPV